MGKIDARKFEPYHFEAFVPRSHDAEAAELLPQLKVLAGACIMLSIIRDDGTVIAIGGALQQRPGVFEVWALLGDAFYEHKKTCFYIARSFCQMVMLQTNCHRLQCTVPAKPEFQRFVKHLGFQAEGYLRQYGLHKEDHVMYSRVQ